MGLEIQLQDEFGNRIEGVADSENLLPALLPLDEQIRVYPMLESIDLYGDTFFHRLQMRRFLSEWAEVASKCSI
jgi:hypothetical protein